MYLKFIYNQFCKRHLQGDNSDVIKLLLLSSTFFCIIGSYAILRPIKTSIFLGFVGKEYQPICKMITFLLIIPCLFGYSRLVDKLKRHQIVYFIFGLYSVLSFVFMIFFLHPTIGIQNTVINPNRFLAWTFEIYIDTYSAIVISTFWGFANSICTTKFASKNYGKIVAFSRTGGIIIPIIGFFVTQKSGLANHHSIPFLILIAGSLLSVAILSIYFLIKKIPQENLLGYSVIKDASSEKKKKTSALEGLKAILLEPYVLGIFGLVYSVEVISIIFDYQMQVLLSLETNNHIGKMSSFMFMHTASFQILALFFALFGISTLLQKIDVRGCLMVMPLATLILVIFFFFVPKLLFLFFILIIMRALNYGFNSPIREMLYIPTTKDVQFKSKAWIDSFGKTFSKTSGSVLNLCSITKGSLSCIQTSSIFSFVTATIYLIISYFIGRKYIQTIQNKNVIGKCN
jgi:ATP:ADP antiporter, AAA family